MTALQIGGVQSQSEYLLLLSATLIAAGLALFIVFHAYSGYRRNDSARMLYLAVGLCLITVVPMSLSIGVHSLGQSIDFQSQIYTFYLPLLSRMSEIVGLCTLLYSLLVVPGQSR
ncbi:DUF7521 family protein [Halostagnicola kamekurae]|uniref:Uncharacterized protein n=1 Tax=Halostagnicola kamekurae TaxID=619731 RepID=A0A1I6TT76_9EURY|nr:hypothetical protein [Halostagnicola kamekurae]SFS92493.1 hypothetical protein SAMN04488556_3417 [Halostagnicola kamekurae]